MTPSSVLIDTSALIVPAVDTLRGATSVQSTKGRGKPVPRGLHPRYVCDLLWEEDRYLVFQASTDLSEDVRIATPMPAPPPLDSFRPEYLQTLESHRHLFKIITPIAVDRFEYLLTDHPNRPFIESVVHSLCEGAWPWAAPPTQFPVVHDLSYLGTRLQDRPELKKFMEAECAKEFEVDRFSAPFDHLLPGMACMPTYVVSRGEKYRLVTDHSVGNLSLNSLVDKDFRAVPLCGLQQLGYNICRHRAASPHRLLVLFKCDVKGAYRLVPMHPLWQMLQAVRLPSGQFAINCNNVFGGGASGRCWWCVMSLILWIASHHYNCRDLLNYVNDVFADNFGDHMVLYPRYRTLMPYNQFQLLSCFDALRVPHDPPKQTCGTSQKIIGMQVDCTHLSITMPQDSQRLLIQTIDDFCTPCPRAKPITRSLRHCQALTGHVNWALNMYPCLRPGLASLYSKMGGPYSPDRKVHINSDILQDLLWLVRRVCASNGVFLLQSIAWTMDEADMTIFTDACLTGIG